MGFYHVLTEVLMGPPGERRREQQAGVEGKLSALVFCHACKVQRASPWLPPVSQAWWGAFLKRQWRCSSTGPR